MTRNVSHSGGVVLSSAEAMSRKSEPDPAVFSSSVRRSLLSPPRHASSSPGLVFGISNVFEDRRIDCICVGKGPHMPGTRYFAAHRVPDQLVEFHRSERCRIFRIASNQDQDRTTQLVAWVSDRWFVQQRIQFDAALPDVMDDICARALGHCVPGVGPTPEAGKLGRELLECGAAARTTQRSLGKSCGARDFMQPSEMVSFLVVGQEFEGNGLV